MVEYPKNFKKDSLKYLGLSVDMRKKENKALGKEGVINNILNKLKEVQAYNKKIQ